MGVTTIGEYLSEKLPMVPEEIRAYIFELLKENKDELTCVEDVVEAVGDHIHGSVQGGLDDAVVGEICQKLMRLLHEDEENANARRSRTPTSYDAARKLDYTVDMSTTDKMGGDVENIWKVAAMGLAEAPQQILDRKKLNRAEERSANKAAKRAQTNEASNNGDGGRVRKSRPQIVATASQQMGRRDGKIEAGSLDIRIEGIDLSFGTKQLLCGADFQLVWSRKYGLVGRNGIGKTTLLKMISCGQLKIPSNITMLSVEQEVEGDETSVIDSVLSSDQKRNALLEEEKKIQSELNEERAFSKTMADAERSQLTTRLNEVYAEMEAAQIDKAPAKAALILYGLGFKPDEQRRPTKEFSGGWRMRVALARALFMKPDLLLLDEPTNMLDMRAVYWLEDYLQQWTGSILIVSHDRKFLNSICTDIVHLHSKRLDQYRGNYENYEKAMHEKLSLQQREYEAQAQLRAHVQDFIDKFRYNAKRASMVQSRIKMLERMPVLHPVERESDVVFHFKECEKLGNPVLQLDEVSFKYTKDSSLIFQNICIGSRSDSRICIVGENGSGKTTLLKILLGELTPTSGVRNTNRRLNIGYFAQHHVDQLDMDMTVLELVAERFPGKTQEDYRSALGRFGLSGDIVFQTTYTLSGGQKSRLAFACLSLQMPNYLIMDEPTNHLDVETVDALGRALNHFNGGVVIVSHDERLIQLCCKELWVVKDRTVTVLDGGLEEYKKHVCRQLAIPM